MQLHRDDVLRGARELIDAEGLDALTMRKLGAALNVQAGALYWHFSGRQALLEAIAEEMLAGIADSPPAGPWDQRLVTLAHRVRRALLGLRDGARLVAESFVTEPGSLLTGRTGRKILMDAGLPAEQAAWAMVALADYILGQAIEQQARREEPAGDPDRRFEFGLGLMIDGIRRLVGGV